MPVSNTYGHVENKRTLANVFELSVLFLIEITYWLGVCVCVCVPVADMDNVSEQWISQIQINNFEIKEAMIK